MITIIKRTREEADRILTEKAEKNLAEVKRKTKKVKMSEYEVRDLVHDANRRQTFDDIYKLKHDVRQLKEANRELKRQLDSITLFSLIKKLFTGK